MSKIIHSLEIDGVNAKDVPLDIGTDTMSIETEKDEAWFKLLITVLYRLGFEIIYPSDDEEWTEQSFEIDFDKKTFEIIQE
jgi:hypothetical protein